MSNPESIPAGRRGLTALIAIAFALLALPAGASAADGGISGKVTLADGGAPVQGAEVCAREKFLPAGKEFPCVETNAGGTYSISGLQPGDYRVAFSAGDTGLNLLPQYWNGVAEYSEASFATVESGATTTDVDAAMIAGGAIAGKVTRAGNGTPVANVNVCVSGPQRGCSDTAADGSYEITRLRPGDYLVYFWITRSEVEGSDAFLVAQHYDGADREAEATEVTIDGPGARKTGIDAALIEGGVIEGTITDRTSGAPIDAVTVCARWEGAEEAGASICGLYGPISPISNTYRITGVHPGLVELSFREYHFKPSFEQDQYVAETIHSIPVSAGATVNFDARLQRRNGEIKGHVYAAATRQPLAGVPVCALGVQGGKLCGSTDDAGGYALYPLKPGAWKVVFSPDREGLYGFSRLTTAPWPTQYWNSKTTLAGADTIDVTAAGVSTGIDGLLGPGPYILPPASTTPAPVLSPPAAKPQPLRCGKGKVKKRVKGKARCVKRHKHHRRHKRHHHRKHHRNQR